MCNALDNVIEHTFSLLEPQDSSWDIVVEVCNGVLLERRKQTIIDEKKKFLKNPNKYQGLIQGKNLYIRGDDLIRIVSVALQRGISKKEISNALFQYGLISSDSSGRFSAAIPGSNTGNRFYCLDCRILKEIYEQENPYEFSCFSCF